jgi:hypothetical protein
VALDRFQQASTAIAQTPRLTECGLLSERTQCNHQGLGRPSSGRDSSQARDRACAPGASASATGDIVCRSLPVTCPATGINFFVLYLQIELLLAIRAVDAAAPSAADVIADAATSSSMRSRRVSRTAECVFTFQALTSEISRVPMACVDPDAEAPTGSGGPGARARSLGGSDGQAGRLVSSLSDKGARRLVEFIGLFMS